ncbi:sensor histidine kinase [Parapedobacter sp. GCM10030251]|uniref:sensor histidine kinase n=1 Tax=Parapedobacter sp. GCM10030251 TaxID=3273419 RepID=UPI0036160112
MEYNHPTWIDSDYPDKLTRITNVLIVFVIVLFSFYWVTRILLDNYYHQKKKADQRAKEVEKQHRKLQQITEEKDKLFSMVFHDLKSPLSSVQLYLQAMANYDIKAETHTYIKNSLLQLTKDTSAMLENILIWISEQQDDKKVELKRINCREILEDCLRIEQPFAESKEVFIVCSLPENNEVLGDGLMTQMILRVFINNAIKFSHSGQRVTVNAHRSVDSYLISVSDEGVGIPMEIQTKLFVSGLQSTIGTGNEKGTGLGLLLAKQYADKQGDKIHFVSVPDKGSTFTLELRLAEETH